MPRSGSKREVSCAASVAPAGTRPSCGVPQDAPNTRTTTTVAKIPPRISRDTTTASTERVTYIAKPIEVPPAREGVWGTLVIEILREEDGAVLGAYERNYPSLFDTFCPFTRRGKDYALYSPNYTTTRVMELPSCHDLGGEEPASHGFCPVDYFVPVNDETGEAGDLGFVTGCIWGDDTSWKIQALDLTNVEAGVIGREERFGHLEVPEGKRLSEAITVRPCDPHAECEGQWIEVIAVVRFEAATGKPLRSYDV